MSITLSDLIPSQASLFDRSHWGQIELSGDDRKRFLHNQTTNHIEQLTPGGGTSTLFVTSTGRTLDLVSTYCLPDTLRIITSPGMAQPMMDWMDRYIFFADKVTLDNQSDRTFLFTLVGDQALAIAAELGAANLLDQPPFTHQALPEIDPAIRIALSSDLALPGVTLWGPKDHSELVWDRLCQAGAAPASSETWEQLRIFQGRPMPGCELTEDDNPLEAGLWQSVSFEKGCYIGQETIARLNTYQGVKKRLWRLQFSDPVLKGETLIAAGGEKVGKVTSTVATAHGCYGLGYIRTKAGGAGLELTAAKVTARVEPASFLQYSYYTPAE